MEIKFKLRGYPFESSKKIFMASQQGWRALLCEDSLRKKVAIPEDCTNFFAVFTKKPRADSWTLTRARNISYSYGRASRLREFRGTLYGCTELLLGLAYERGYRYVHIEYVP